MLPFEGGMDLFSLSAKSAGPISITASSLALNASQNERKLRIQRPRIQSKMLATENVPHNKSKMYIGFQTAPNRASCSAKKAHPAPAASGGRGLLQLAAGGLYEGLE